MLFSSQLVDISMKYYNILYKCCNICIKCYNISIKCYNILVKCWHGLVDEIETFRSATSRSAPHPSPTYHHHWHVICLRLYFDNVWTNQKRNDRSRASLQWYCKYVKDLMGVPVDQVPTDILMLFCWGASRAGRLSILFKMVQHVHQMLQHFMTISRQSPVDTFNPDSGFMCLERSIGFHIFVSFHYLCHLAENSYLATCIYTCVH